MKGIRGIKKLVINILKNLIRVGRVSSIDYEKGTVRVTFPDKDNIVSAELPYLSFEYYMPDVQDTVLCIFLGNGISKGFCLGKFYNRNNVPGNPGKGIYYKHFFDEGYIKYDMGNKTITIDADKLRLEGNTKVVIEGGNIYLGTNASEAVAHGTSLKSWLDGHTHPGDSGGTTGPPTSSSPPPSTKVYVE